MRNFLIIASLLVAFQVVNAQQKVSGAGQAKATTTQSESVKSLNKSPDKSDSTLSISKGKTLTPEGKHQISYYLGGGLSSFKYTPLYGERENGLGFTTGFDYSYFWHPKWGISVGFSFDSYNSSLYLNKLATSTATKDGDTDNDGVVDEFNLISHFNELTEKQHSLLISLPIEIKFRQPFSPKTGIVVGVGPKLSTAITSTSQVTEGTYTTEGIYPQYGSNTLITDGPGFETYSPRSNVKTDIGFNFALISELDFYYKINPAFILYAGPYFVYQLNTIKGKADKPLVQYNATSATEANSSYNPILSSSASGGANQFALGGKIGLTFDFGGYQTVKKLKRDKEAELLALEAARLALLRQQATADSLANALRLSQLRNKAIADSIANAQKLADEAARLALLKRLAEQQRIKDSIENAKNVAVVMDIKTKTLSEDELLLLKLPIIFEKGSADITSQSKINAQRIGEMLSHHPSLLLRITGHTCDLGDDQANYRLGLRRAQTLFNEFTQAGVMPKQVTTFSKGETEPVFPNINEDNRRRNRRVVVVIEDEL